MGQKIVMYRWRVIWIDKWVTTRHLATREDIMVGHPEAIPIPSTRVEMEQCDDPMANSAARFYVGFGESVKDGADTSD